MDDYQISKIESQIDLLQNQVQQIIERNNRVQADKAWEISRFRVLSIVLLTYFITCIVFYVLDVREFYLSAIIPTLGYYLSTQGLPILKNFWLKHYFQNKQQKT